jgi:hypothetical protein
MTPMMKLRDVKKEKGLCDYLPRMLRNAEAEVTWKGVKPNSGRMAKR